MPRYYFALPVPANTAHILRDWYSDTFHTPCLAELLHLTLIPPFFLKKNVHLNQIEALAGPIAPIISKPTGYQISQHDRRYFFLTISPTEPFHQLHTELTNTLTPHIDIDCSPYQDQQVPPFVPHITLSYNFTHAIPSKIIVPNQLEIPFTTISLLKAL